MREILCRGKGVGNGEWFYGIPVFVTDNDCYIMHKVGLPRIDSPPETEFDCQCDRVLPETVGQFTGLKVEKIDLYESDIIMHPSVGVIPEFPMLVSWKDGGFWLSGEYHEGTLYSMSSELKDFKYLGNKFENPELLETK